MNTPLLKGGTKADRNKTRSSRMKRNLTITFLSASAFAVGCDSKVEEPPNIQAAAEKATLETKEAAQAIKEYAYAQRAEFVEKMQSESAAMNAELDLLAEKVESAKEPAKAEAQAKLKALREKADELNKHLDKAKDATASTWDSIKSASKESYEELKVSFQESRQWLSEKIAP
jgi:predicted outer membrane protein